MNQNYMTADGFSSAIRRTQYIRNKLIELTSDERNSLKSNLSMILYKKHLNQFKEASKYNNQTHSENETEIVYHVWRYNPDNELERNAKINKVIWKKNESQCNCSCKLFDVEGIICRHIFHILARIKNLKVPSGYIHPRWKNPEKAVLHEFEKAEKDKINLQEKEKIRLEEEEEQKKLQGEKEIFNELLSNESEDDVQNENEAELSEENEEKIPNFQKKEKGKGIKKRKSDQMNKADENEKPERKKAKK